MNHFQVLLTRLLPPPSDAAFGSKQRKLHYIYQTKRMIKEQASSITGNIEVTRSHVGELPSLSNFLKISTPPWALLISFIIGEVKNTIIKCVLPSHMLYIEHMHHDHL
ncbi:hypothetical protein ACJX0J_006348, partial [Zea mays]